MVRSDLIDVVLEEEVDNLKINSCLLSKREKRKGSENRAKRKNYKSMTTYPR